MTGAQRTNPLSKDTDGDGLEDGVEDANRNAQRDPQETSPAMADTDEDGLSDGIEIRGTQRTDPLNKDTDADDLLDGEEDKNHNGELDKGETNPTVADTDFGGVADGEEVHGGSDPLDDRDDFVAVGRGCSAGGVGTFAPLAVLLLALGVLWRRGRSSRPALWGAAALAFVSGLLGAGEARASEVSQAIDVQQYKPGPGLSDILGVQGARVGKHMGTSVGASLNYATKPLNFMDPRTDVFQAALVKSQLGVDLFGSISLYERVELGLVLPLTIQSSDAAPQVHSSFAQGVSATGVGDLRVVPKVNLLNKESLALAVSVPVVLPSGGSDEFLGGSGVAVQPRLLAEFGKGFRVAANIGVNFRREQELRNLHTGNELAFGLGAELPFTVREVPLSAEATLVGAMGFKEQDEEERPLELLAALKYRGANGLSVHLGAGPGLTRGYGSPGVRVLGGLTYSPVAPPAPPPAPVCPQGPEDVDGFEDEDGCADPDNDGDGILDVKDACPNAAETMNGYEDADGCPDEAPPAEPPAPVDTDDDGVVDGVDRCVNEPEDKDGFEDADGCPDPDNDRDGIADGSDKCPTEPETINGVTDEDGCPDKGKVKVFVEKERIVITEKVFFATNKDAVLPISYSLLAQVAQVMRANPHIERVRVEGHTDDQGTDEFNKDLSQRRANNVRERLLLEGVEPDRLEAMGYGESRPVDTNTTDKGREANRRVEFTIVKTRMVEVEQEVQ
ncbi:OmpA family protein [Myxococcaceae bacterium GXIMD 01537]